MMDGEQLKLAILDVLEEDLESEMIHNAANLGDLRRLIRKATRAERAGNRAARDAVLEEIVEVSRRAGVAAGKRELSGKIIDAFDPIPAEED